MINKTILALAAVAATLFSSCSKEETKTIWSNQEELIDRFVSSELGKDATRYCVSNHGAQRIVLNSSELVQEKDSLASDGTVSFRFAGYTFKGSISINNLFATNDKELAENAGWTPLSDESAFELMTMKLDDSSLIDGLRNGLEGVKKGEECYILFSSRYGYGKKGMGNIPGNTALIYHILVSDINNE